MSSDDWLHVRLSEYFRQRRGERPAEEGETPPEPPQPSG
jgi:hypothetical protein